MYEVVYDDNITRDKVEKRFPEFKVEDASDFIHTNRFSVVVPDDRKVEFYVFAAENAFLHLCLGFQSLRYEKDTGEKKEILDAIQNKLKEMKRESK